jgi:CheY-like chemotaxis protein
MLDSEGNFRHICCFLRDVTKHHLNDRILEMQRKSTQSLLELKDTFLKRIFNEMKTPLHTLFSHLKQYSTGAERLSLVPLSGNHSSYELELVLAPTGESTAHGDRDSIVMGQKNQQISRICHLLENISSAQQYQENRILQVQPISLHFPLIIQSLLCQAKDTELRPGHHLQFQMELAEATIRTDKMIQCVLYNLFANAIRYSPPDQRPHPILFKVTSSHPAATPAVLHHFTLTNTFSPPIDLTEISQRFKAPSHSFKADGSHESVGLGLYVSSQIIRNLGGRLECHCYGSEITFQFTLSCEPVGDSQTQPLDAMLPCLEEAITWIPSPATPMPTLCEDSNPCDTSQLEQGQEQQWSNLSSSAPRNKRPRPASDSPPSTAARAHRSEVRAHTHLFLIVEDSTLCQKIVMKLLTSFGFRCDVANNGYEALEKLKIPPCVVDVVLMDLRMPVMDGITAIKEIRKYPHLQYIPIIVTTAEVGPDIENEVYLAGGNHFLTKPVKRMELAAVLQKYIPLLTLALGT